MTSIRPNLVYGLWRDETLAVVGLDWAEAVVAEILLWEAVQTLDEARALAARDTRFLPPPFDPADFEGDDGSEPFRLEDCGMVNDGDWPGMVASRTTDWLPAAESLGQWVETIFNGAYLCIEPDQENALQALRRAPGVRMRRDDVLINAVSRWPH